MPKLVTLYWPSVFCNFCYLHNDEVIQKMIRDKRHMANQHVPKNYADEASKIQGAEKRNRIVCLFWFSFRKIYLLLINKWELGIWNKTIQQILSLTFISHLYLKLHICKIKCYFDRTTLNNIYRKYVKKRITLSYTYFITKIETQNKMLLDIANSALCRNN